VSNSVSQKTRIPFTVLRTWKFLRQMLSNKLALTGAFLLIAFMVMAVAAPLLTPYPAQGQVVSGPLAAPSWVKYFKGDAGLSQNINFAGIAVANESGVTILPSVKSADSIDLQVSSVSGSGGRVSVQESMDYPYTGPPLRFSGGLAVTPSGSTLTGNIAAVVYVNRFYSNGTFLTSYCCLWNYSGPANIPFHKSLDSYSNDIVTGLGIIGAGNDPSQYVFGGPGKYTYVLQMNLPSSFQGRLSVQNFDLNLYGNTWGIMGTDSGGQDIFTQFVYGARLSIYVGLTATILGIGVGLVIGLMAGYLGKIVDEVLMRFTDMILVIPFLPLLIVLSFVLGPSLNTIVLIIGLLSWPGFARLIRSQVLSIRERPFIEAAKASGAGTAYILTKHVFPNIIALTYVNLALSVPAAIVGEAALSFLGLGDPTQVTWGKMLELARGAGSAGSLTWWWIIPPGIGIAILSLSFILIGYSLDEIFNPRLRRRR
jgi:peptide/nickel transport system permease protein